MGLIEIPASIAGKAIAGKILERNQMDQQGGPQNYAGFLKRLLALLIDGVIISVVFSILGIIFGGFSRNSDDTGGSGLFLINSLISWMYYSLMECSEKQATLGKLALGIQVTDLEKNRLSLGKSGLRNVSKIISWATCGVGFLMPLWTQKRQTLHDLVAGCLVVNK